MKKVKSYFETQYGMKIPLYEETWKHIIKEHHQQNEIKKNKFMNENNITELIQTVLLHATVPFCNEKKIKFAFKFGSQVGCRKVDTSVIVVVGLLPLQIVTAYPSSIQPECTVHSNTVRRLITCARK